MSKKKNKFQKVQDPIEILPQSKKSQCQCHAQVHKLINNCLNCGRIVCEQEGEGPCQTCNQPVFRKGAAQIKKMEEEFPEIKDEADFDMQVAIAHKDKLLQYDKSNFMQKQIFDEQTDYYQIAEDVWQQDQTRKQAINKLIEKQDQQQLIESQSNVHYDAAIQEWVSDKVEFDENKFKQEAQNFMQLMMNQDQEKLCAVNKIRMSEIEQQIYNDIKSELKVKQESNKQEIEQLDKKPQNPGKIVQNDDLFLELL